MVTFEDGLNGVILVMQDNNRIGTIRYAEDTFFFKPSSYVYYDLEAMKAIMDKLEELNNI